MEKILKEELILKSASLVHKNWCIQELAGFFKRAQKASEQNQDIVSALQMACYKDGLKRNEVELDVTYFAQHKTLVQSCLFDFDKFMTLYNTGAIAIKRFVKRDLTDEEIKTSGSNYRNGEENILRPFKELSTDSKKENLEAAIGAFNVYEQLSQAGITLEQMMNDLEIKKIIGIAIHTDWLKRNMDHPNENLKIPYEQLDEWTQQQDLTVFNALLNVVKENKNKYFIQPVEGVVLKNYVEEERALLKMTGKKL